ncbi:hypothetical protein DSL72_003360 [Monilinia vaccinii-corymbosi]|uniref:2EXR domain-containing protein n=1 Tax=Monilinia vaccinii-corymbosi TaxID=61207 RepID=A0A8A3NT26_9HELO|nr:hypothetical protein DSL72_003360 [Monilinia vaccinii-corymbosi]
MSSFSQFIQLPFEIQFKIWTHALETPRMIPRTVKVDYDPTNFSYRYMSQPPPLTQTCRTSRKVALENYSVLNPSTSKELGAIYFSPTIDTLYYNPSYQTHPNETLKSLASTPWLDPKLPPHLVKHIMLTKAYVSFRAHHSFLCPIAELIHFENLQTIYIELPSHRELERKSIAWYRELMRFSTDSEPTIPTYITDFYTREQLEEASGPRDVVPGYVLLPGDEKGLREHQILASFGWQGDGPRNAWLHGDRLGGSGRRVWRGGLDDKGMWRDLPAVRYLRRLPGE